MSAMRVILVMGSTVRVSYRLSTWKKRSKTLYIVLDVDECSLDICSNFSDCIDTPGNFSCVCDPGYELVGRTQCLSKDTTKK